MDSVFSFRANIWYYPPRRGGSRGGSTKMVIIMPKFLRHFSTSHFREGKEARRRGGFLRILPLEIHNFLYKIVFKARRRRDFFLGFYPLKSTIFCTKLYLKPAAGRKILRILPFEIHSLKTPKSAKTSNFEALGDGFFEFSDFEILPPRRGGSRGGSIFGLGGYWGVVFPRLRIDGLPPP